MSSPTHFSLSTFLVCALMISSPASADWGSMLDDLKSAGQSLLPSSSDESTTSTSQLDTSTIIAGLKQALEKGSEQAITSLSQTDGYLSNPEVHIPMPPRVQQVSDLISQFGMSSLADEFETSLNRAAEQAAPAATDIVLKAIRAMTFEDAKRILNGEDDAATSYFRDKTSDDIAALFKPSIETSLNQVGSTRYYNQLSDQVAQLPIVGQNLNVNLPDYVTEQALEGLFTMLAAEEKKIRENPAARTTELLKQVFSQ